MTNLLRVLALWVFCRDLLDWEMPNAVCWSDGLVSQDVLMFTSGSTVRTEWWKQKRRSWGVKQMGLRYFDNERKKMGRWVMESCGSKMKIGGRKTGRWLLVPLLFSNCLAAFCRLGPRTPRRFSSAESHEKGSSGIVSDWSATGELTQMLLFSSGGTTETILYQFPCLASHGWGNH